MLIETKWDEWRNFTAMILGVSFTWEKGIRVSNGGDGVLPNIGLAPSCSPLEKCEIESSISKVR